ncbi:MAG: ArsA family ATPase [Planctomycetes bacterium]|uniref:ArsA family ATPase n=1 Tax=Candidatus Wunengus sp. YC65 TaxID=3367701 RepID=UPI001D7B6C53|nr:ArsA family ATPase [Planctomycetota bacterium]
MNNVAALKPEVENILNEKTEHITQRTSFLTNPQLSLICFGGKGGVGKTTSAAATALYLAKNNPQKRILLASVDPAHSLMDSLIEKDLFKNLMVWEIDAYTSFQQFMKRHSNTLKIIMERGTLLDNTDISALLSTSLPGIDELMGMIELVDLLENDTYDTIVLDTAPTGHTVKFLQMPHLIKNWTHLLDLMMEKHRYMSKLYMRHYQSDDTDAFIEAFSNGAKKVERVLRNKSCEFVPVMVPEALSVNETKRFLSVLRGHKIPVKDIIVNRVNPFGDCSFCNGQYLLQKKYIDDIKHCFDGYNLLMMPLYKEEIHGRDFLLNFAEMMTETTLHHGTEAHPQNTFHINEVTVHPHLNLPHQGGGIQGGNEYSPPLVGGVRGGGEPLPNEILHSAIPTTLPFIISANPPLEKGDWEDSVSFSRERNRLPIPKATIEFLMFGGKGGVGKTTIASASALSLADIYPEKRVLLFSTDPAHSLSDCLGVVVGEDVLSLKNNLYVQEMDAGKEYKKLKCLYTDEIKDIMTAFVKGDAAINVVFEKEIMESFIDMTPPGIDEVMAIATIIDYMDKGNFDLFILDTAPTGHLIRFLEMPELVLDWLKFFFNLFLKYKNVFRMPKLSAFLVDLSKKVKKLLTLLRDNGKSLFIPIAIPTEMAYHETSDLVEALWKLKIPVSQMILNMAHPPSPSSVTAAECALCINRIAYERKTFDNFKHLFPVGTPYVIYRQEQEVCGVKALENFGRELYEYH